MSEADVIARTPEPRTVRSLAADLAALGDIAEQAQNCLATIGKALQEAGFAMEDVVRVHYHVTDAAFADPVFAVVGKIFGDIRPAATMTICGLIRPEMKIEIEATALKR